MNTISIFFLPFLFAFLASYILTPYIIRLSRTLGIIDDPKKNKHPKVIHTYPVPRGGGMAIFVAIALSTFLFLPFDKHTLAILIGALILTITGILDDKYNINP